MLMRCKCCATTAEGVFREDVRRVLNAFDLLEGQDAAQLLCLQPKHLDVEVSDLRGTTSFDNTLRSAGVHVHPCLNLAAQIANQGANADALASAAYYAEQLAFRAAPNNCALRLAIGRQTMRTYHDTTSRRTFSIPCTPRPIRIDKGVHHVGLLLEWEVPS